MEKAFRGVSLPGSEGQMHLGWRKESRVETGRWYGVREVV